MEKYAAVLDIENLPESPICLDNDKERVENESKLFVKNVDKTEIAWYGYRAIFVQTCSEVISE